MTQTQQDRPLWTNSFEHFTATIFGGATTISADSWLPDPAAREIELPAVSVLFGHLEQTARSGGIVYLTRFGRRVAAVVPADVAESFEQAEADREPGAGVRELLREAEERLGPVPPEVAAEVDRQWDAALASM
jgi:hypothetical protein